MPVDEPVIVAVVSVFIPYDLRHVREAPRRHDFKRLRQHRRCRPQEQHAITGGRNRQRLDARPGSSSNRLSAARSSSVSREYGSTAGVGVDHAENLLSAPCQLLARELVFANAPAVLLGEDMSAIGSGYGLTLGGLWRT